MKSTFLSLISLLLISFSFGVPVKDHELESFIPRAGDLGSSQALQDNREKFLDNKIQTTRSIAEGRLNNVRPKRYVFTPSNNRNDILRVLHGFDNSGTPRYSPAYGKRNFDEIDRSGYADLSKRTPLHAKHSMRRYSSVVPADSYKSMGNFDEIDRYPGFDDDFISDLE